jgi:hypothetical protein
MVGPKPNLLSQIHPYIMECQILIKCLPKGLIKRNYLKLNNNQVINYWWSGNINTGHNVPNFISLADHPYLPTSIFGNQNPVNQPQPLNNQPGEVNKDIFGEEDGFQTPPSLLQPSTLSAAMGTSRRGSRTGSRGSSRGPLPGRSLGYNLANVRSKLWMALFQEACH